MISQITATMTDCQKLRDWRTKRSYCNFQSSVVVAVAGVSFVALGVVENPTFAVGIAVISIILSEI